MPVQPVVVQPATPSQPNRPIVIVQPEVPRQREPEAPISTPLPEAKVEEKPAQPPKPEEKASEWKKNPPISEEKASDDSKKRKVRYEGEGGRIHTESQIDEILDFYLMTGELPVYVSDRQRYDYRHHERLPGRKELLERRGVSVQQDISGSARHPKNVFPIKGAKTQRKKRASS